MTKSRSPRFNTLFMLATSHALISVIIFGPNPEAVLFGAFIPDSFMYLNTLNKYIKKEASLLDLDEVKKYNKIVDSGKLWQLSNFLHGSYTFIFLIILLMLSIYINSNFLFVSCASFLLHIFIDKLSHKNQKVSDIDIPFTTKKYNIAFFEYNWNDRWVVLCIETLLLSLLVFRLTIFSYIPYLSVG